MKLRPLPALADNYIWMLHDGCAALVVDPGDPTIVLQALEAEGVQLQAILVTHHHGDHVGGVAQLQRQTQAPVSVHPVSLCPNPARLQHLQHIHLLGLDITVLGVPGHTAGILPTIANPPTKIPSCFAAIRCSAQGVVAFEGTPAQMQASLALLMDLPDATRVCCAHEYTLSNLRFAATVEPDNHHIAEQIRICTAQRGKGLPTLPSTLGRERQINLLSAPNTCRLSRQRACMIPKASRMTACLRHCGYGKQLPMKRLLSLCLCALLTLVGCATSPLLKILRQQAPPVCSYVPVPSSSPSRRSATVRLQGRHPTH